MTTHLSNNLYISNDSTAILDFLVDNNLMPKDFNSSKSISHSIGKDFFLVLFLPKEKEEKFLMFEFIDFASCKESLVYVYNILLQLSKEDYATYKPAQRKIEEVLHMLPVYRAFYGYKEEEDAY